MGGVGLTPDCQAKASLLQQGDASKRSRSSGSHAVAKGRRSALTAVALGLLEVLVPAAKLVALGSRHVCIVSAVDNR